MKTIEFIVSYLRVEATHEERQMVKEVLKIHEGPFIEPYKVVENLIRNCRRMYDGLNKFAVVKFAKDTTGWGLKECKDWCDENIFPYFKQQDNG